MCMARIGAVQEDESAGSDDVCAISYLTDETKQDIRELPSFSSVTNWMKNLAGTLVEFTLIFYEFIDVFSLWKRENI